MHIKNIINQSINLEKIQILEQRVLPVKNINQKTIKMEWNNRNVRALFLGNLELITKKKFLVNPENRVKLYTIIYYLTRDAKFINSPLLVMKGHSAPNFDKGLLLIGGVGTGKSSFLKAMSTTIESIPALRTTYHLVSNLVKEYEGISQPLDMNEFNNKYCNGRRIFDDLLREKTASNFGKTNLPKELLASRYDNKKQTHAAINYSNQYPGDIEKGLDQIGERYGDFIYDRMFDMFNIIQFPGKSMRC